MWPKTDWVYPILSFSHDKTWFTANHFLQVTASCACASVMTMYSTSFRENLRRIPQPTWPGHTQEICPIGTYCLDGIRRPCPAGTYGSAPGLSSSACSGLCPAGRYCPIGTTTDADEHTWAGKACPAGRYGGIGMENAACAGLCAAGYYCPAGAKSPRERKCGSGRHFCPEGSGAPEEVSVGWYATGGEEFTRTGQAECVQGITPPSGAFTVERCPENTVGWNGTTVNEGW